MRDVHNTYVSPKGGTPFLELTSIPIGKINKEKHFIEKIGNSVKGPLNHV